MTLRPASGPGQLSKPTVNIFLYDLREAERLRTSEWSAMTKDGRTFEGRPPMVMECSYAVTAWTQAVEDEHRLLSQVLAILYAYPEIPQEALNGRLANGSQHGRSRGTSGRARARSQTSGAPSAGSTRCRWIRHPALGGVGRQARTRPRSPTQTVRTRLADGPARAVSRCIARSATSSNKKGEPLANVWVALPDVGTWTASAADGRFRFDRLPPGRHRLLARTVDGVEAVTQFEVPGAGGAFCPLSF